MPIKTKITCDECGKPADRSYKLPIKYGGPTIEITTISNHTYAPFILCFTCLKKAIDKWFADHTASKGSE